jgi:Domain of unknown function (DUF4388)
MDPQGRSREGVLSSTTFPGLIYSILQRKETGVLTLTGDAAEKSVYIQAGRPVFATSNHRDDRLGQIFFRRGQVSLEDLIGALDRSIRTRQRLGTVLVESGVIRPHDLVDAVLTQVRDIVCSLFLWTRGRYRYVPGALPSDEVITLKLSPGDIILQGIRQIESWDRIWEAVGNLDVEYQTTEELKEGARDLKLSLEEWTLLSHLERPLSLRQLCRTSPMKDFDICRLLWALLTLGIVNRTAPHV